ncbi:plasmid recombination protein [Butyrivibrio sp. YAB3001]|uniref:plasmid recombination protein n=1 Tax=Butyrivibrio sp. YAB3001 TaxID=1520812 RepID=UPI0008F65FE6|nr:plasmid recombination protein [Butyrivibrio sp. YAB3001]SFC42040.1 hypothetical protein SAMN02910398_02216 [Butyrivibrio sp. YAB3001]
MKYTISTHNGTNIARQHNLRNSKVVSKEKHVDLNGRHETWLDIKPEEAYKTIFNEAVKEYNENQKQKGHSERQIKNYYKKIQEDKKKHSVYEMIIAVGSYENHPDSTTSEQILKEFCASWSERNPNLVMIGCYYHADEAGANHVHIDYIPVADNLSRGMKRQNALVKSLNQMGYGLDSKNIHDTAQIQWEKAQNQELERICNLHGLEIDHPKREKQAHMNINEYRQQKMIEELERKNKQLEEQKSLLINRINGLIDYHNDLNKTINSLEHGATKLAHQIVSKEHIVNRDCLTR